MAKPAHDDYRANLLAVVSHELNTPLVGILGAIHMLEENYPNEREYIPMLRRNAERLREQIQKLLELSRVDAGALRVRLTEFDLQNFVHLNQDLLRGKLQEQGFEFDLEMEEDLPRVCADPRRLGSVFAALVSNAMKFSFLSSDAKKLVRVRAGLSPASMIPQEYFAAGKERKTGLYATMSVQSSLPAVGERPESFEQLFEPFSPWRDLDTRERDGLGVDLALAREILLAHDGFIWATESETAGEGWCFHFALPILSREEELDLVIASRVQSAVGGLAKVSLLLLRPQGPGADLQLLAQHIQKLLFRSSDSLFWVPETGEVIILMDDCDAKSAAAVAKRLIASLKPVFSHTLEWARATGPDHGASAEQLLGHARAEWHA